MNMGECRTASPGHYQVFVAAFLRMAAVLSHYKHLKDGGL
jgi:hypothetical protein